MRTVLRPTSPHRIEKTMHLAATAYRIDNRWGRKAGDHDSERRRTSNKVYGPGEGRGESLWWSCIEQVFHLFRSQYNLNSIEPTLLTSRKYYREWLLAQQPVALEVN